MDPNPCFCMTTDISHECGALLGGFVHFNFIYPLGWNPGLTYWRLEDHELYHPLPDSLGRGTFHLGQENSRSLVC